MSSVYLINVGANAGHSSVARSPIFVDDTFVYVPFPTPSRDRTQEYAARARAFVRDPGAYRTHADPDWVGLTYGDYCANPRAAALKRAVPGDILLFWGLLWRNRATGWSGFTGERDWYLLGALRVGDTLSGGQSLTELPREARARAARNAHVEGEDRLRQDHRVFVGDIEHSMLFVRAVCLGVSTAAGLLYRAFAAASGELLSLNGKPAWRSSLRSCRPMWDLATGADRRRAEIVRDAISARNDFDLLAGL